jgi:hypothetical protein
VSFARLPNQGQARKLLNGGLPAGQEALKAATARPWVAFGSLVRTSFLCALAFLICGNLAADQAASPAVTGQMVDGLWLYTGLTTADGKELPLTGIFLFKDGAFVQQSIFDGSPFEEQGSMAHAGPYTPAADGVHLVAEQTISTSPRQNPALSFRSNTEHDITVSRAGDDLTIIFGKGTSTVQTLARIGPGDGELYSLENGSLAFVDGYFILVEGDESGVVTGYGTFEKNGDAMTLNVIRWSEADSSGASNLRDTVMQATFDGRLFTLQDGRSFQVAAESIAR